MVQVSAETFPFDMQLYEAKFTETSRVWRIWTQLKNMPFNTLSVIVFLAFKCLYAIFRSLFSAKNNVCPSRKERWSKKSDQRPGNKEHSTIRPFKINVSEEVLRDLKLRLEGARYEAPLQNSDFQDGFNSIHLQKVTKYWETRYDWKKHETELNKYPQFKTRIDDLDIHFLHVKPIWTEKRKLKVIPLLLIHGWPGSCANFHKLIPLLTYTHYTPEFVFEVVCPSMPGFGFSEAPRQKGFTGEVVSQVLLTLMDRLGFSKFYVLGSGCGAIVASLMGRFYPYRVQGVHVDMCFSLPKSLDSFLKIILLNIFPFLVSSVERRTIFPLRKKLQALRDETGFFNMENIRHDAFGCAMTDSPVGMAAYFLEKSFATNPENILTPDWELLGNSKLDELLTMVTIYWINNNFNAGARFYKENIKDVIHSSHERLPLTVPVGVAVFPNEVLMLPKMIMEQQIYDLVSYTIISKEGHFGAMDEPHLLAKDLRQFVQTTESRCRYT